MSCPRMCAKKKGTDEFMCTNEYTCHLVWNLGLEMRTPLNVHTLSKQACVCSADVDECLTHKCLPHQRCVNTEGSFTCRPQITCPPGYHLKSSGCQGEFTGLYCSLSADLHKQSQCKDYPDHPSFFRTG